MCALISVNNITFPINFNFLWNTVSLAGHPDGAATLPDRTFHKHEWRSCSNKSHTLKSPLKVCYFGCLNHIRLQKLKLLHTRAVQYFLLWHLLFIFLSHAETNTHTHTHTRTHRPLAYIAAVIFLVNVACRICRAAARKWKVARLTRLAICIW